MAELSNAELSSIAKGFAEEVLGFVPAESAGGHHFTPTGHPVKVVGTSADLTDTTPNFGIFKDAFNELESDPESRVCYVRPDGTTRIVLWSEVRPVEPRWQVQVSSKRW